MLLPPAVAASAARKSRARRSLCFFFCVCVSVEREWEEGGESALEVESPFLFRLSIRGAPRKKTARFPSKIFLRRLKRLQERPLRAQREAKKRRASGARFQKKRAIPPRRWLDFVGPERRVLTQFLFSPSQPLTIAAALLSFSDARGKRSESVPKRKKGRSIFGHTRNKTRTRGCDWKTRGPAADVGRVR